MIIGKNITEYLVSHSENIFTSLHKMNSNSRRVIFVVNEYGQLRGSVTDGDFKRWVANNHVFDLNQEVLKITNKKCISAHVNDKQEEIDKKFTSSIDVIPLLDNTSRVVGMAIRDEKKKSFMLGKTSISENSKAFIIAEIGNNHNGDVTLAEELVDLAYEAGADCVKFQMREIKSLYKIDDSKHNSADLGSEYTLDLLKKFQLTNDELFRVFDYCKSKGVLPLCTPWDLESLTALENYGLEAYKVASADLTNPELLTALVETGKPLICSTGMSTELEIKKAVKLLQARSANFVLMHCNSTYPTPYKDVNLGYMSRLKDLSSRFVGYSGHERGISIPIAAVALGAKIIEKHFTVDKSMEGNDHKVSLLPAEFKMMVDEIRKVETSLGGTDDRIISQGELFNRKTLAKSLVARNPISKGDLLKEDMFEIKSPGQGLQPIYLESLVGKLAKRDFDVGDYFYESDLNAGESTSRNYSFKRPFGIPVRYHDYAKLVTKSNFDFVEFHLSYSDMKLNLRDFFKDKTNIGFAVHSPELFEGDHIMNLASDDDEYRKRSIQELQRVCEITRELKVFFPKTIKPLIIINAGGFSTSDFVDKKLVNGMYEMVAQSLDKVDTKGVEVIIQTMPPFPWHFGGQSFHNLFVHPDEIKAFCETYGYRICYDTSHSMMAANYYKYKFDEFTKIVGSYVAHMHVSDASGVDGEGVEIGSGDIDFELLVSQLDLYAKDNFFLPEVWQGHKNEGEGFWTALEYLEAIGF